jgi:hypothetical protein
VIVVTGCIDPRWKVEMEAEAIIGSGSEDSPDDG